VDHHLRSKADVPKNQAHVFRRNGNAAFRRRIALPRDVKEDRATLSLHGRVQVAIQHDDDVVEPVVAPHLLVAGRKRQLHRPVVETVARVVTPARRRCQRLGRQQRCRRQAPVRAIIDVQQFEPAHRRAAIAFSLAHDDARPAERTRDRDPPKTEHAACPVQRRRTNFQHSRRFFQGFHDPVRSACPLRRSS